MFNGSGRFSTRLMKLLVGIGVRACWPPWPGHPRRMRDRPVAPASVDSSCEAIAVYNERTGVNEFISYCWRPASSGPDSNPNSF